VRRSSWREGSREFKRLTLHNWPGSLSPATIAMDRIQRALDSVVSKLSDENYEQSFALYRFWFDIGQTYHQIPSDLVSNAILSNRTTGSINAGRGELIHTTAHLTLRFANDVESDRILALHNAGLQSRLCARILQDFFSNNLEIVWDAGIGHNTCYWACTPEYFYANTNFVAHWANLGYVEETTIRDHILQSLITYPKLYDHQADALIILFKLAGATFEAYADPSTVDRAFELLKAHYTGKSVKRTLVQVRGSPVVKGSRRAQANF
jgi:hypothetical protein